MIRPFYPFMRAKIKLFFSSDLIHEIKKSMKKKNRCSNIHLGEHIIN